MLRVPVEPAPGHEVIQVSSPQFFLFSFSFAFFLILEFPSNKMVQINKSMPRIISNLDGQHRFFFCCIIFTFSSPYFSPYIFPTFLVRPLFPCLSPTTPFLHLFPFIFPRLFFYPLFSYPLFSYPLFPCRELAAHDGYLSCCRFVDENSIITSSGTYRNRNTLQK